MKTRVLLLLFTALAWGSGEETTIPVEEIYLSNGLDRGDWGPTDLCAKNSWVSAFEVKYSEEGHIDNTGLNAVRLYCQDKDGGLEGSVISLEGSYGEWKGIRSCPAGEFMVAMRGDVMPYQGTFGDDEGLVNLEMRCSNGTVLDGRFSYGEEQERPEDNLEVARERVVIGGREMEAVHIKATLQNAKTSEYSLWATCSRGNRICGLATEVEHETTFTDDAGLCNIVMYCCTV